MLRKLFLVLILILVIAVVLVPNQADYFQRLENDFGQTHQSVILDIAALKEVGDFHHKHRLIFSEFNYSFGNISVSYYGFLNIIIFKNSTRAIQNNSKITV